MPLQALIFLRLLYQSIIGLVAIFRHVGICKVRSWTNLSATVQQWPFLWTNITRYSNSLIFGQVADHANLCYPVHGGLPPVANGCVASRAYKLSFLLLALQRCINSCCVALQRCILFALHTFYFCVRPFCMPCAL